jgi:hypothetical protein
MKGKNCNFRYGESGEGGAVLDKGRSQNKRRNWANGTGLTPALFVLACWTPS